MAKRAFRKALGRALVPKGKARRVYSSKKRGLKNLDGLEHVGSNRTMFQKLKSKIKKLGAKYTELRRPKAGTFSYTGNIPTGIGKVFVKASTLVPIPSNLTLLEKGIGITAITTATTLGYKKGLKNRKNKVRR